MTVDAHRADGPGGPTVAPTRCAWVPENDPLYRRYHDEEWGVPVRDDVRFFEMLTLEGAQAGLSWSTILNKREGYRIAFDGFDPATVAAYSPAKIERLLREPAIVRNRLKVASTVGNASAVLDIQREFGSFATYLWSFVGGAPIVHRRASVADVPAETPESHAMSRALRRRGFRFVGPTICYALMQATGLVNDHEAACFRHPQV